MYYYCLTRFNRAAALVHDVQILVRSSARIAEEAVVCWNVALVLVLASVHHLLTRVEIQTVDAVAVVSTK